MSADPILSCRGLGRHYRGLLPLSDILRLRFRGERVEALSGLDLDVAPGEFIGLVGPNGSGKSTFLRVAAGLLVPSAGRLTVEGHEPYAGDARGRRSIGSVFGDSRSFFWRLSGRENLRFFAALHGLGGAERDARIEEALSLVELDEAASRRVMAYSSGMRQRLAFARALLHRPRLLLLDEVTQTIDPDFAPVMLARLDALRADGAAAVIYATHRPEELEGRADRVLRLEKGHVVDGGAA
jgi:ABC-2 type transport system ATP-binding protein